MIKCKNIKTKCLKCINIVREISTHEEYEMQK